jgi:hypothetical protein
MTMLTGGYGGPWSMTRHPESWIVRIGSCQDLIDRFLWDVARRTDSGSIQRYRSSLADIGNIISSMSNQNLKPSSPAQGLVNLSIQGGSVLPLQWSLLLRVLASNAFVFRDKDIGLSGFPQYRGTGEMNARMQ